MKAQIEELTGGYSVKADYFVERLASGIAQIGASQFPNPVIVRLSNFKTNEYSGLIGSAYFEPTETHRMLGFRGTASRFTSKLYKEGFELECRAIRRVRDQLGLSNVAVMIPFCHSLDDADQMLRMLAEYGLQRGENALQIVVMAEVPSNILLAEKFAHRFDGFAIGGDDLRPLIIGAEQDAALLAPPCLERSQAVRQMIRSLSKAFHRAGGKVTLCCQTPEDYGELATFLVEAGIDSISLKPDNIFRMKKMMAEKEQERRRVTHLV